MINIFIVLIIFSGAFIHVFVINNPKRWLEVSPITITDDQIQVTIKNKSASRVSLEKLAVAWKIDKRQFYMVKFDDKLRELRPFSEITDSFPLESIQNTIQDAPASSPIKTYEELLQSIHQSQYHQIMIDLKINGKRKGSSSDYSSIRVPIINELTQPLK